MTDPIADMLIRIKNAQAVGRQTVKIPFSGLKLSLAQILEKAGFVGKVEKRGKDIQKYIKIDLKYKEGRSNIGGVRRMSRPGQRLYVTKNEIRPVKQGYGLAIISTSKGLMTNKEARKIGVGGELMCEIW
ncbi:MAG: 30S ribosomal protein S8 [Candidatus Portnoybacteria bacterium]|nr:30S ribosomal protein S8 [Candidatus Portnoybacteria bacterium]